jgi:hypothetical protein
MTDSDLDSNTPRAKYVLWLMQNVLMPLLPILISALVDSLIHTQSDLMSEEAILIYTILLPVLYLERCRGPVQRYIFWTISAVGLVLYTVAHLLAVAPLRSDINHVALAATTYHVAGVLDILYILTASTYEYRMNFSTNRQVA